MRTTTYVRHNCEEHDDVSDTLAAAPEPKEKS